MLNSEEFLKTFADVEAWLRKQAGVDRSVSFYQLIDRASEKNPTARRYRDDLKEYADLRNAIVHERRDVRVIAEPNDRAVEDFQRICTALLNPPKVIPQFKREVKFRNLDEQVGHAVSDMRAGSFSQLPILDNGKVIALLTSETVVRWLASELHNDLVSLSETSIKAVLPHTEEEEHYCFLPRHATLPDALSRFEDFTTRGKDLDAILITETGRPDQSLLGILTVYDLPAILETLGLRRVSAA